MMTFKKLIKNRLLIQKDSNNINYTKMIKIIKILINKL